MQTGLAMASPPTAEQKLHLARRACEAVGLNPQRDARDVVELSEADSEDWEECCEGGCEPCVAVLQSAALVLRRRLAADKNAGGSE
jgi:hypothetical protein